MINPDYTCLDFTKPSNYLVMINSFELKSSSKGVRRITWWLRIHEGPGAGKILFLRTPIEGSGAIYLKRFLAIIDPGYHGGEFDPCNYIGKTLWVNVSEVKSQGSNGFYQLIRPIPEPESIIQETNDDKIRRLMYT